MIGLDQTCVVYAEDAATGAYTAAVKVGLRCRLAHVNRQAAATSFDRAELAAIRNLIWEPSYVMPETAQVEVNAIRWNVRAGTFGALRGPGGQVLYRRCDVTRAGA